MTKRDYDGILAKGKDIVADTYKRYGLFGTAARYGVQVAVVRKALRAMNIPHQKTLKAEHDAKA